MKKIFDYFFKGISNKSDYAIACINAVRYPIIHLSDGEPNYATGELTKMSMINAVTTIGSRDGYDYMGVCRCINEFRTISRMLNIK